jgi:hypothetical protein
MDVLRGSLKLNRRAAPSGGVPSSLARARTGGARLLPPGS